MCLQGNSETEVLTSVLTLKFDCRINGHIVGAALWYCLSGSGWQVQNMVSGSHCGPRQDSFRKKCSHCCDTGSVQESKQF